MNKFTGGQDNYVPEDLISLLDAGINAEHPSVIIDADAMFSEDMFGYSQRRSSSSNRYLNYAQAVTMIIIISSMMSLLSS